MNNVIKTTTAMNFSKEAWIKERRGEEKRQFSPDV